MSHSSFGWTTNSSLHRAAASGDIDELRRLLASVAKDDDDDDDEYDGSGAVWNEVICSTYFHILLTVSDMQIDVNERDDCGCTALHLALFNMFVLVCTFHFVTCRLFVGTYRVFKFSSPLAHA